MRWILLMGLMAVWTVAWADLCTTPTDQQYKNARGTYAENCCFGIQLNQSRDDDVVFRDAHTLYDNNETKSEPSPSTRPGTPLTRNDAAVYITKTASMYQRLGCRDLCKSCTPISLSEAKAEGYTPCSLCKRPE